MDEQQTARLKQLKIKYRMRFITENFLPRFDKIRFDDWGASANLEILKSKINLMMHKFKHIGKQEVLH